MLVGQGLNLLLQAGYFVLLARLLGVREYGVFVGAFALVSIATPYSALGSGLLFMQYVSTKAENFAVYWGNILLATLGAGSLVTALLYFAAPHLLNAESASVTLLVALGECMCRQIAVGVGQIFQTFEHLRMTAAVSVLTNLLRLTAVIVLAVTIHHASAWQWALASLAVSVLAALVCSGLITARFGLPRFKPQILFRKLGEGLNFSLAGSTQSIYNDIDKAMLSHYGMNIANGIYTLAYRIVDLATIPVTALDSAALPRYFRQRSAGHGQCEASLGQAGLASRARWSPGFRMHAACRAPDPRHCRKRLCRKRRCFSLAVPHPRLSRGPSTHRQRRHGLGIPEVSDYRPILGGSI